MFQVYSVLRSGRYHVTQHRGHIWSGQSKHIDYNLLDYETEPGMFSEEEASRIASILESVGSKAEVVKVI